VMPGSIGRRLKTLEVIARGRPATKGADVDLGRLTPEETERWTALSGRIAEVELHGLTDAELEEAHRLRIKIVADDGERAVAMAKFNGHGPYETDAHPSA